MTSKTSIAGSACAEHSTQPPFARSILTSPLVVWFIIFALLVIITRLQALRFENINWDESTFIIMASDVMRGHLPYLDVWDNKPPILFFLLATTMDLFGESLATVRSFGGGCLLIAAVFTFQVCRHSNDAVASGMAVAVMICLAALFQPTMSEYPAIVFLMLSLWLVLTWRGSIWSSFVVGILMSIAALTRMNIGYLVVALGLYYALPLIRVPISTHRYGVFAYGVGAALPLIALGIVYWFAGRPDMFVLSVFVVPFRYASTGESIGQTVLSNVCGWWNFIKLHQFRCGPFTVLVLLGLVCFYWRERLATLSRWEWIGRESLFVLLFTVAVAVSIFGGGRLYTHYWIQLFPFAAIFVSYALSKQNARLLRLITTSLAALVIVATLKEFVPDSIGTLRHWSSLEDRYFIRQTANLIAQDKDASDKVFALQAHLVYWYLHQKPLSLVVHPSMITSRDLQPLINAGYVTENEFTRILDTRPRYIVKHAGEVWYLSGKTEESILNDTLYRYYFRWKTIGGIEVYKLR